MDNNTQLAIIEIAEQVLLERMKSKGPTLEDARQLEIYAKLKQLLQDKPTEVVKSMVSNEISQEDFFKEIGLEYIPEQQDNVVELKVVSDDPDKAD